VGLGHYVPVDSGRLAVARHRDGLVQPGNRRLVPETAQDVGPRTAALTRAWFRKRPAPGRLHHSDRGSPYASDAFQDKLTAYGMTCAMSRKGNGWDNAPTESGFNRFKNERVPGVSYATHADLKAASCEYIAVFYNRKRLHSTLGYRSPV